MIIKNNIFYLKVSTIININVFLFIFIKIYYFVISFSLATSLFLKREVEKNTYFVVKCSNKKPRLHKSGFCLYRLKYIISQLVFSFVTFLFFKKEK